MLIADYYFIKYELARVELKYVFKTDVEQHVMTTWTIGIPSVICNELGEFLLTVSSKVLATHA